MGLFIIYLSSLVGDISGVVGVVGLKNTSSPSPKPKDPRGTSVRNIGRDGARVFVLRGRDFTRCCSC